LAAEMYFGHGFYGLPAAARGYFGVTPAQLS
jgi:membrane peptidoglycan carboxypeptidase